MPRPRMKGAEGAIAAIERACESNLPPQELIESVAERIQRVVPADGWFMAATDPETALCMGAGIVRELPPETCQPYWDLEFLVPDFNKFADLALGPRPVADLHEATGGRPQRSARYRELRVLAGFEAEVRAVFTAGGLPWGVAQLNRERDARFSEDEMAFLADISPIVGRGLRSSLLSTTGRAPASRGPGMLVLDEDGELLSFTADAERWLEEIDTTFARETRAGLPVPIEVTAYAAAVRAQQAGLSRARLRTRNGVWLVAHASPLNGADGQVAVVIEPAKASDVAPVVVEAYGLTQRELEVTRLVARGMKTAEIANQLILSPHTVRDHLKAIFEKVGVTSRGELTSRLFAEHYHDGLDAAITGSHERVADRLAQA